MLETNTVYLNLLDVLKFLNDNDNFYIMPGIISYFARFQNIDDAKIAQGFKEVRKALENKDKQKAFEEYLKLIEIG